MKHIVRMLIQTPMPSGKVWERPIEFSDWFEFADFAKQANERGEPVTIVQWTYIKPQAGQLG